MILKELKEKNPNIIVIGDLILDKYLWGSCDRISPEAPVQIIDIDSDSYLLGGAGNVANNLISLGASVTVLSVVGQCSTASKITDLLKTAKVNSKYIIFEENRRTSEKTRLISSQQQVIRFDTETLNDISEDSQDNLITIFSSIVNDYDFVVLSDYGKGVLTEKLTQSIIKISQQNDVKLIVDPKGSDYSKYKGAFTITPNKKEAILATGINITDTESLTNALIQLKENLKLDKSLITLSHEGIAAYDKELKEFPTSAIEVFDVSGAGDTVIASLAFGLSSGLSFENAIKLSNLAAGVVVAKIGSATANIEEIIEFESKLHKSSFEDHIKDRQEIKKILDSDKILGKKIVFTNGCFDILHIGHVKYLQEAKRLGDILVVGINSDSSVRKLKGSPRPFNSEEDRSSIIASLESVDYVVIFDEETPEKLIKFLLPDTLVKGGDYQNQTIAGQEFVNEVKLINFVEGKSTTSVIEKIKEAF